MEYEYHTEPFDHQHEEFLNSRMLKFYALFWEQGTGKTKVIVDTAAYLYERGLIDALFVIAPNGVHRNWTDDEIPIHMPTRLRQDIYMHCYQSEKAGTKYHQSHCRRLLHHDGLAILAMSYHAFKTKRGRALSRSFLGGREALYVLDESSEIKSPSAKRTISVVASGIYAPYRRILEGTPVSNGPFDVYSPIRFLDRNFWKRQEMDTFTEFKTHFAKFNEGTGVDNKGNSYKFKTVRHYRRLDELRDLLKPISSRVLKKDVLDLPPKLYSKRYFDMAQEQARVYKSLVDNDMALLESGGFVTTQLAIVKLLRLQQVTCGYVPTDEPTDEPEVMICDKNPRLNNAVDWCDKLPHKAIIWARFRKDIDLLEHRLGDRCVRYDGAVDNDSRALNKHAFMNDDKIQFFLANPTAAGRGLTLTAAQSELFYSSSFKLAERLQAEDRAHRIGQEFSVGITDIVGTGTVDNKIVNALRKKWDVSNQIMGDDLKEWI